MEIMFDDLTYEAQQRLLDEAGVATPEEMNWDRIPLAVVEFEDEEEGPEDNNGEEELLDDADGDDAQY